MRRLGAGFFKRNADIVAKELLGKVLAVSGRKARIVETEAYLGEEDPASYASKGDNKVSRMMKEEAGRILVYNVHKYKMLNFVCEGRGKASAVLIRAVEPLNFDRRCYGPGLLTLALKISDELHGKFINEKGGIFGYDDGFKLDETKIGRSKRIGVSEDLKEPLRFFIQGGKFVSGK